MALANTVIASHTIEVPGNEPLVVRGIGLPGLIHLITVQGAPLQEMYEAAVAGNLDVFDMTGLASDLAKTAPDLVGHLIATAAEEPQHWQTARALPLTVQLEALEEIGKLTFAAAGGPKKLMETVIRIMGTVTETMALPEPLPNGHGLSAVK